MLHSDNKTWKGSLLLTFAAVGLACSAVAQDAARTRTPSAEEEASSAELPESVRAERALLKEPHDRAARLRAARAQLAEGAGTPSRVDAAQEHALAVLADDPANLEALLLAGQTSVLKGDAGAAARYYRLATLSHGNSATAFLGLGNALTRLGDEAGATAAFRRYRALKGMPALPSASTEK